MTDQPTPKPMPVTSMPDRAEPNQSDMGMKKGATLGKMQVTNGRPPKGGK